VRLDKKAIGLSAHSSAPCRTTVSPPSACRLSGAARGRFGGDVSVPLLGVDRRVEVKCRGTGFCQLYAWLDDADLLIIRADRSEPLVVIPFRLAIEIAQAAEGERAGVSGKQSK
jgi:hypothetical protein